MTSKISSAKLWKEAMKRNMAVIVLMALIYFCAYPLISTFELQSWQNWENNGMNIRSIHEEVLQFLFYNPLFVSMTIIAAALLGILQFSWLHSRKKTDFYHSLPISRERLFMLQYVSGVCSWAVPFLVNYVLAALLLSLGRISAMPEHGWLLVGKTMLLHMITFLLIYSFMALAMVMTGKIFVGILGMGVFCGYGSFLGALWIAGLETCYLSMRNGNEITSYVKLSPVYGIVKMWERFREPQMSARDLALGLLLLAAVVALIAVVLYRKRGSEAAGKAMAFEAAARVIKFLLVVPGTVAIVLFFYILGNNSAIWGIFGFLFGLLLISGIIEFIYRMDIREIFRDKRQIGLSMFAVAALLIVLITDPTGIDDWVPQESEVESVILPNQLNYAYQMDLTDMNFGLIRNENKTVGYQLTEFRYADKCEITDLDPVFALLERRHIGEQRNELEDDAYSFGWKMKNGCIKYRTYYFDSDDREGISEFIKNPKYLKESAPFLSVKPGDLLYAEVFNASMYDDRYVGVLGREEALEKVDPGAYMSYENATHILNGEERSREDSYRMVLDREQRSQLLSTVQDAILDGYMNSEYGEDMLFFLYVNENGEVRGSSLTIQTGMEKVQKQLTQFGYHLTMPEETSDTAEA
ncbi:MAG: hypothetical protein Q4B57_01520 [Eubacteriales bacterium]|nr:hypothetical protein [Eubacteriales bacterium]